MIWPTLINLHPNKCSQDLHYYPFAVSLDRSAENASKIIYHVNANVSLMEENVTWIKCEITISVGVSTKTHRNISVKKVNFGILQHGAAKMVKMQEVPVIQ